LSFVTHFNAMLPFAVSVAGPKRDALFRVLDPLFNSTARSDVIETEVGPIRVEGTSAPERFLSYAFFNILKHYQRSDLGRYIAAHAGPGKTFLDIGANLGVYAFIARRHGYATFLVEPEPMHAAFLAANSATLGRVLSLALSDQPGEMPLFYQEHNSGATSLVPSKGFKQGSGVVPVRTFTALAEEGAFGDAAAISLMKVDVEGAEARTIAGMRGFLEAGPRPAIWCEVRGDRSGRAPGTYREVDAVLAPFGYTACEYLEGRRVAVDFAALASRSVFDLLFEVRRS
jgi:FkbM family methyltransferase